jgi:eukaryotic-like serine/threonine-protein kinase
LTVHVLEAVDPAAAILEFAKANHVDHIIIAGQSTMLRSLLGSVSARVAAEAACTVTVVRPPRLAALAREDAKEPSATRVASVTNPSSSRPV